MNTETTRPFSGPERRMPAFEPTPADLAILGHLEALLRNDDPRKLNPALLDFQFKMSSFPKKYERLIFVLYAPGHKRILVSRGDPVDPPRFSAVLKRLLAHPRCRESAVDAFRLQIDFVVESMVPIDFYAVGMTGKGERHFQVGVDGLLFKGPDGKLHLFPPGDAYVRSVMGMGQLRAYLHRVYGEDYVRRAAFSRMRSESFLSGPNTWLRLYRGYPLVGEITREKIEQALELAIGHIRQTQAEDGKFLYYYNAALDSRRDHEHPNRDPLKNPFYNILRHAGGGLTCIYYEKYHGSGKTVENIRRAIDYLVGHTRTVDYSGRTGAYIYSEKKAKLGGTGIALYLAAEYQLLSGDARYRDWADQLAWHLLHQVTETGEFMYYHIYLDQPVSEAENGRFFSFYYPGEAVCGLAKYLHLVDPGERGPFFEKLRKALAFLLDVRPVTRAEEYTAVPSDSWLMMGIMELWDFDEMREEKYADAVFADARKMIDRMYKVTDAPYPDYAGAFYYNHGDYPYSDGARCEGLLGAYQLAVKTGNREAASEIRPALKLAAWSLMHLVNTPDAIYFAPNPSIALGGIRFKYTRQWFRIDTIQHVASFYAKLLPHWDDTGAGTLKTTKAPE